MLMYVEGSTLPDTRLAWRDPATKELYDFEDGWTFEVKVGLQGETAVFTKTEGISWTPGSTNILIQWEAAEELSVVPAGTKWFLQITAIRTVDQKLRKGLVPLLVSAMVA